MSSLISLNSKNIVNNGYNNSLRYEFSNSSVNFNEMELCVSSIQMYNSQFNISKSIYNNSDFQVLFPVGNTTTTLTVSLLDGYYNYSDMNKYLQQQMITLGAYLIDSDGNYVYYIQILANPTYYACQIDLAVVPTSLPVGYTRPATGIYSAGGSGLPTTAYSTQIQIYGGMRDILGFTQGLSPVVQSLVPITLLSQYTPQINPTSCYNVRCNLVKNIYNIVPDLLTSFTTNGTTIGELISIKPNEYSWINVQDSVYSYVEVVITDQNYNFVKFEDNQITIQLLVRQKSKKID